ncbi:hypothetical protein CDAR_292391 [Caerostris darwini]|uniref:Uncharacterized protein n=1 Tax=Caerostris darwini TaxID=1538125 RepID=A0AAV4UDR5_9ARAC|nr:hypothetical protein CDAR_292391 [Caerostris darwini]
MAVVKMFLQKDKNMCIGLQPLLLHILSVFSCLFSSSRRQLTGFRLIKNVLVAEAPIISVSYVRYFLRLLNFEFPKCAIRHGVNEVGMTVAKTDAEKMEFNSTSNQLWGGLLFVILFRGNEWKRTLIPFRSHSLRSGQSIIPIRNQAIKEKDSHAVTHPENRPLFKAPT